MSKQNTAATVENAIRGAVEELGYRLWDVRYEKEGSDFFLRVFIEGDNPIGLSDCETVSRAVDPLIDAIDPITEKYYMEVSSPGLGRRLVKPAHFTAFEGETVSARLIRANESGEKDITGTLVGYVDGNVRIETDGTICEIPQKDTSYIKLCDDENLFSKE